MSRRTGFTLIELLVVIGIIVILVAILYPVFGSVREKARQTNCRANLHQVSIALKSYRADHGHYPPPPFYDGTRYLGGISALSPEYLGEKGLMICPDDRQIDGMQGTAKDKLYSSYNGWVDNPQVSWDFQLVDATRPDTGATFNGPKRTYNYHCYSQEGWDAFDPVNWPYLTPTRTLPAFLKNDGLRWRHFPALSNRTAPDSTIITHCVHHRERFKRVNDKVDMIITVGGSGNIVNISQMGKYDAGGVSNWVAQKD